MISASKALELGAGAIRLAAAREAIQRLNLLVPAAEGVIFHMLGMNSGLHPRALCLAYRKDGEQLVKAEKKALGLRSNAFISRRAFDEITPTGMEDPLAAHETVLLRATFTFMRYRTIASAQMLPAPFQGFFRYDMLTVGCPACRKLDRKVVPLDNVHLFAPAECRCETANYGLQPHIDWLAGID